MKNVNVRCSCCNKLYQLEMTDEQYQKYVSGKGYIQDIFSDWTPGLRELLISRTCQTCWNKIFNYEK